MAGNHLKRRALMRLSFSILNDDTKFPKQVSEDRRGSGGFKGLVKVCQASSPRLSRKMLLKPLKYQNVQKSDAVAAVRWSLDHRRCRHSNIFSKKSTTYPSVAQATMIKMTAHGFTSYELFIKTITFKCILQ